ncbi:hypothetical protein OG455_18420 [Kitasatospora sp. NBC_01287]|uniref:hypothetical protein n=1 Tax=Kitasatospora sp. NBC_01287 TaxID=2903573 RepID=UPI00225BD7BC|nr:hypothetical protein [Kitasatospora sp. NBC_01287]MCX4747471.1 hypothetical protein [Kitasatospora sp. NBC_01287]
MSTPPRRHWWIIPAVSTAIAAALLALDGLIALAAALSTDACPEGGCPGIDGHFAVALVSMLACAPLATTAWITSRQAGRPALGGLFCLLTPLAPLLAMTAFLTVSYGS